MIIFSRSRTEKIFETEMIETIALRFRERILSIPFLYDLRFSAPTLQRLRTIDESSIFLAAFPERASKSLLDFLEVKNIVAVMDTAQSDAERILKFLEKLLAQKNITKKNHNSRIERLDEPIVHRWYPVIDRRECVGCLECVNFCLFGVYVIGKGDQPIVDQPDACRNGCPACARVCPRAAIMFPMHEEPDIAGRNNAENVREKIDPSQAEKERRHHRSEPNDSEPNELDDLVEQVDRLIFR